MDTLNSITVALFALCFFGCVAFDNLAQNRTVYAIFPLLRSGSLSDVTDGNEHTCIITFETENKAFIRIDLGNVYTIRNVSFVFRPQHIHRIAPFRIFLSSQFLTPESNMCYRWTDTTQLPPQSGTYPCPATGRYLSITSTRDDDLPAAWRPDEEFATMSFCDISVEGCRQYGRFGENCNRTCYCRTSTCDYVTGACPNGECADGWQGPTCSERTVVTTESIVTMVTESTSTTSHISGIGSSTTPTTDNGNRNQEQGLLLGSQTVGTGPIVAIILVSLSLIAVSGLIAYLGMSLYKDQKAKEKVTLQLVQ